MSDNRMMQTVTIHFSDGRKGSFTGPPLVKPEEVAVIRVVGLEFTTPKLLPKGCYFGPISDVDVPMVDD